MAKNNPLSIYLLKPGFNHSNSMKEDGKLKPYEGETPLPEGFMMYYLDNPPTEPWWIEYFGVDKKLTQITNGSLVFARVKGRCFAFSFGYAFHELINESYEYDFGLRVTLNCIDPKKLKSIDTNQLSTARRQRTQIPNNADLKFFDFDGESNIINGLTGLVNDDYNKFFQHATGTHSFKCVTSCTPNKLKDLLEELLELYKSTDYQENFPEMQKISPVNDPEILEKLDENLLSSFTTKDVGLFFTVPEIIDYLDVNFFKFNNVDEDKKYEIVRIDNYYEYLQIKAKDLTRVTIQFLKNQNLIRVDDNNSPIMSYQIYKCFICETKIGDNDNIYYLTDGKWYEIDSVFASDTKKYLDGFYEDTLLPDFGQKLDTEGKYNIRVAKNDEKYLCLDRKNISPFGQLEPCDLYSSVNGVPSFIHVKRETTSHTLSHLFNQGLNSAECIRSEPDSLLKLNKIIITEKKNKKKKLKFTVPKSNDKFKVVYAIITHKDQSNKSDNLPFFSRLSLKRTLKSLKVMNVDVTYQFINNKNK